MQTLARALAQVSPRVHKRDVAGMHRLQARRRGHVRRLVHTGSGAAASGGPLHARHLGLLCIWAINVRQHHVNKRTRAALARVPWVDAHRLPTCTTSPQSQSATQHTPLQQPQAAGRATQVRTAAGPFSLRLHDLDTRWERSWQHERVWRRWHVQVLRVRKVNAGVQRWREDGVHVALLQHVLE